jgi:predicted metalloprotease
MRWQDRPESENVEDHRDDTGPGGGGGFGFPGQGGGGFPFPIPTGEGGGVGIVGVLVIVGIALFLGVDPRIILGGGGEGGGYNDPFPNGGRQIQVPRNAQRPPSTEDESLRRFSSVILKDTEITWAQIFQQAGRRYVEPKLYLYRGGVQSGCGLASAQMGPFYCPLNQKVYLDLSFFEELKTRFNSPGEFAQAYVIAHEVGHHVQNLLGTLQSAQRLQQAASSSTERNAVQVRVELQADCYAGVWAKTTNRINGTLEPGDIEAGLRAAAAIGDDALQRQAGRRVAPDSFTHGSSAQRVRWFRQGYEQGTLEACDTFSASQI